MYRRIHRKAVANARRSDREAVLRRTATSEPALLAKLIDTINEVRNSAPFGQQYKWDHSLREALNSLKCFDGADNEMMMEMRTRYKAMVAHFYSKIRAAQVPKTWKEQIPLTGKLEMGPGGQIQAKL